MREKEDMRDKRVYTKKKGESKKKKKKERKETYLRKGKKLSTYFGRGSHVYRFIE